MNDWEFALTCAATGDAKGFRAEVSRAEKLNSLDDLFFARSNEETCLYLAAAGGHLEIVDICAKHVPDRQLERHVFALCLGGRQASATVVVKEAARRSVPFSQLKLRSVLEVIAPSVELTAAVIEWFKGCGLADGRARLMRAAAASAHPPLLEALLSCGCDPHTFIQMDVPWGLESAPVICEVGKVESSTMNQVARCVDLLSSSANSTLEAGITPLMLACAMNRPRLAQALLPYSDPRRHDDAGQTALMFTVLNDSVACAELLAPLSDWSAKTVDGETAVDIAIRRDEPGCRAFFESWTRSASERSNLSEHLTAAPAESKRRL